MSNLISKIAIGVTTLVAAGVVIKKMDDNHKFDRIKRRARVYMAKAKRDAKNMIARSKHEAEYLRVS